MGGAIDHLSTWVNSGGVAVEGKDVDLDGAGEIFVGGGEQPL